MIETSDQYRDAPRLRSPGHIDQKILGEAHRRCATRQTHQSRWTLTPVLAALSVAVVASALLLKGGYVPGALEGGNNRYPIAGRSQERETNNTGNSLNDQKVELSVQRSLAPAAESAGSVDSTSNRRAKSEATSGFQITLQQDSESEARESLADRATEEASPVLPSTTGEAVPSMSPMPGVSENLMVESWFFDQPRDSFTLVISRTDKTALSAVSVDQALTSVQLELSDDVRGRYLLAIGSFRTRDQAVQAAAAYGLDPEQPRVITFGRLRSQLNR